jgi:hypothetical protein
LFDVQRAGGCRRDREKTVGGQLRHHARRARYGFADDLEHIEQRLLPFHTDERHAHNDREQHDGGDDVVGHRVERVGGDIEGDEVERRGALDERCTEKRCVLDLGKGQGHEERKRQRHSPEAHDHRPDAQRHGARLPIVEAAEAADDRHDDVREYGHLEQLDEPLGRPGEHCRFLPEEEPDGDAGRQAGQDLLGEGHRARLRLLPEDHGENRDHPEQRDESCHHAGRRPSAVHAEGLAHFLQGAAMIDRCQDQRHQADADHEDGELARADQGFAGRPVTNVELKELIDREAE